MEVGCDHDHGISGGWQTGSDGDEGSPTAPSCIYNSVKSFGRHLYIKLAHQLLGREPRPRYAYFDMIFVAADEGTVVTSSLF